MRLSSKYVFAFLSDCECKYSENLENGKVFGKKNNEKNENNVNYEMGISAIFVRESLSVMKPLLDKRKSAQNHKKQ